MNSKLHNRQLKDPKLANEIQQQQARTKVLLEATRILAEGCLPDNASLQVLARLLTETTGDDCAFMQLSQDGRELAPIAFSASSATPSGADQLPEAAGPDTDKFCWQAIRLGRAVTVPFPPGDSSTPGGSMPGTPAGSSYLAVPLRTQGQVFGCLRLRRERTGNPFTANDEAFVQGIADVVAAMLANEQLREQEERLNSEFKLEIDERKGAEELLARQASILQEQADLLDLTYDAILVRDLAGRIRFWNRGAEDRYGWRAEEVFGQNVHELLHPIFPEPVEVIYEKLFAAGRWEGEVVHARRDGTPVTVFGRWALQRNDEGHPVGVLEISSDISELKAKESALALQGERLQILHEIDRAILAAQSPEEIAQVVARRIRSLIACGQAAVVLFEFESAKVRWLAVDGDGDTALPSGTSTSLADFPNLPPLERGKTSMVEDLLLVNEPVAGVKALVLEGMRSYVSIPLMASVHLIGSLTLARTTPGPFGSDELAVGGEVADSLAVAMQSARLNQQVRTSRQQLQNLSRRRVDMQERERRYVADQLFNEAGQVLAALKMHLATPTGRAMADYVAETQTMLDRVMQDLHHLATHLRPVSLDRLGLVPALKQYAEEWGREHGLQVQFEAPEKKGWRIGDEAETAIYRVIQEALANVAQHAEASGVAIVVSRADGRLAVVVEDDGVGFDPELAMQRGALGLLSMRERAEAVGARLVVESLPGRGTTVFVEIPIHC